MSEATKQDKRIAADILITAINNDLFDLSCIVHEDEDDISDRAKTLGTAFEIILESVSTPDT